MKETDQYLINEIITLLRRAANTLEAIGPKGTASAHDDTESALLMIRENADRWEDQ